METQKNFAEAVEKLDLILVAPEPLRKFQKGQAARIETIYKRLIEIQELSTWVTLDIFIKSAKCWGGFRYFEENQILQRII